jgi:hypothetical protein
LLPPSSGRSPATETNIVQESDESEDKGKLDFRKRNNGNSGKTEFTVGRITNFTIQPAIQLILTKLLILCCGLKLNIHL